jgi:hypothetical protein
VWSQGARCGGWRREKGEGGADGAGFWEEAQRNDAWLVGIMHGIGGGAEKRRVIGADDARQVAADGEGRRTVDGGRHGEGRS